MNSSQHHQLKDRHRILYAGANLALLEILKNNLEPWECRVMRCPDGWQARRFIQSHIHYDLFVFDDDVSGLSSSDLCCLARLLSHRQHTPILIYKKKVECLSEWETRRQFEFVKRIKCLLGALA
jgi:DNA-binding response OmpR family regulator